MIPIIAYIRVSTDKQGKSGLGLEAQVSAISSYAANCGAEVVKMYEEVESGKLATRPQLLAAIDHAKRLKCKLVIAKLDRLARNLHFISGLMQSGVDFIACDNPSANKLTIHILAAVAEAEADAISARTKAAFAVYKAEKRISRRIQAMYPDGVPEEIRIAWAGKLGSNLPGHWDGREELRRQGLAKGRSMIQEKRLAESAPTYAKVMPLAIELLSQGKTTRAIAAELNQAGLSTAHGAAWSSSLVSRLLMRPI